MPALWVRERFRGFRSSIEFRDCDWSFETQKTFDYKAVNKFIQKPNKLQKSKFRATRQHDSGSEKTTP